MTEPSWPQMEKGRPVPGSGGWKQPPGPSDAAAPAPRPDDPAVVDASLLPPPPSGSAAPAVEVPEVTDAPEASRRPCRQCGGQVDADGYCTHCGAKAPTEREHFEEAPAAWVGAVCDRGVAHTRNEDALATWADAKPGSRAALVVCDGVTTSEDSDVAALAAARVARDLLSEGRPETMGTPASRNAAVAGLFARAAAVANDAVAANTRAGTDNPAACTFAGALVLDDLVHAGNVGDSRVYWLPDGAEGRILTRDDSLAEDSITAGVPRKEAEDAANAHTITRWLGVDAQDIVPRVSTMHVPGPGWVLVCSDGLWNYASEPVDVAKVLADAVRAASQGPVPGPQAGSAADTGDLWSVVGPQPSSLMARPGSSAAKPAPVDVARAMVDWAIDQGGHDNISVILARVGVVPEPEAPAALPDGEAVTKRIYPAAKDPAPTEPAPPAPAPAAPSASETPTRRLGGATAVRPDATPAAPNPPVAPTGGNPEPPIPPSSAAPLEG